MTKEGQVRRVDLYLRSQYVEVDTTIYKMDNGTYLIHCQNFPGNFIDFKNQFHQKTRIVGTPVDLIEVVPENYQAIIPAITDKEIPKNFEGIPMSTLDLLNLLLGKFPDVYFFNVTDESGKVIVNTYSFKETIGDTTYSRFLSQGNRKKIMDFFEAMRVPYEVEIREQEVESPPKLDKPTLHNPVQYIYANGYRRSSQLEFADRDQTLWYENIEGIFEGKYKKNDLYFFDAEEYSCYVDYSSFENIDIRNHLFLYQTVYVTLPYEKNLVEWLKTKKIRPEEFLELVKRGRIKIVLTQPEARYDIGFLTDIYRINPKGIITRRAISALHQIDIVEISDDYIFNDPDIIKVLGPLSEILQKHTGVNAKYFYDMMVWPIRARRNSFQNIHASSITGVPGFGVNTAIQDGLSQAAKRDLTFEFMISSSSVHLSNALNATYFPFHTPEGFSDFYFANIMGELLNFYKNANPSRLKAFEESRMELHSGVVPINPIEIFNVNDFDSIMDLEGYIRKDVDFGSNQKLMGHLASLTPEEREKKIQFYNDAVETKLRKSKKGAIVDLGSNILMDTVGKVSGIEYLGSIASALKSSGEKISDSNPGLKKLRAKLYDSFYTNEDKLNIHYLSRINRVAKIKWNK